MKQTLKPVGVFRVSLIAALVPATVAQAALDPYERARLDGGTLREAMRRADEGSQPAIPELPPPGVSKKTIIRANMPKLSTQLSSLKLSIKEFRVEGLSPVSADALDQVLEPWKGRELSFAEFEKAVHAVADYLRDHGHPNAEVAMSRALLAQGTVAVAINGLNVPANQLALKPEAKEAVPTVQVNGFKVSGVTLASDDEIQGLLKPLSGRALTLKEMEGAAEIVANHLRAKGYPLVQAYLPPQKIDGGMVEIAVQEARVDPSVGNGTGIAVTGVGTRVKSEVVEAQLATGVKPNEPLRTAELERAVLLAQDTPGIKSVRTNLSPGRDPGTTRVDATVEEANLISGTAWVDNYGSRYTGATRYNLQANVNSPSGNGEQLSLNAATATGMTSAKVAGQALLGTSGAKVGASISSMNLKLGQEVAPLNLASDTNIASVFASYALERSAASNTYLNVNYDDKHVQNSVATARQNDRKIGLWTFAASGDLLDSLGGQLAWGASFGRGNLNLSGNSAYQALDAASARTEGSFTKLNWNLARQAALDENWSWALLASGQTASKNLDSSEKFQLGGPTGVRAYPVGEALGDSGWLGSAELRYNFGATPVGTPQVFGFFDTGHVTQYKHLWTGALSAGHPNSYSLSGYGLGASLQVDQTGSVRIVWAKKSGSNPNPTSANTDSDGTSKNARVWIVGNILF